ncbi:MAG: HNH endonuclease [Bacteroidetes bacterium]|nr:MAG: HNH endonuclease [Bacteroidota bacterium]
MSMMEFGQESQFGWEIDHIVPVSCGGTDEPSNLQALHWENNAAKGELYPVWGISENGAVRGAR